tara:strand:- start:179 stop:448 length:270 start_codon:yes stop_codon:yes gene_type:complete
MAELDDVLEHRVWQLNKITGDNYEVEGCNKEGRRLIRNHSTGGATDVNQRKIIYLLTERMTRPAMIDLLNALLYVQYREHEKYVRERLG